MLAEARRCGPVLLFHPQSHSHADSLPCPHLLLLLLIHSVFITVANCAMPSSPVLVVALFLVSAMLLQPQVEAQRTFRWKYNNFWFGSTRFHHDSACRS